MAFTTVPITIRSRSALVPLGRSRYAIVDSEDYEFITQHRWTLVAGLYTTYAYRNPIRRKDFQAPGFYMHQVFHPEAKLIDHRDGNGLNNRRSNLRPCSNSQNIANSRRKRTKSGFKGVHWYPPGGSWRAQCRHKHVGYFATKTQAAEAYDAAAIREFGEFAKLNFPKL